MVWTCKTHGVDCGLWTVDCGLCAQYEGKTVIRVVSVVIIVVWLIQGSG